MPTASLPSQGCVVPCRSHRWLVEEVEPADHPEGDTVVRMACLDDNANGQKLEVLCQRGFTDPAAAPPDLPPELF